jgi:hypothetical protein
MAKNPFEIRLELLQIANSILSDKNWAERNRMIDDYNNQREIVMKNGEGKIPFSPKVPTVDEDEIIALARKLNEFVSNG